METTPIKLSEQAVAKVKEIMAENNMAPETTFLRVGIKGMSCSGPAYSFGFDEEYDTNYDDVVKQDDITVVHNKSYTEALDYVEIDFHDDGVKKGFTFKNTNPLNVLKTGGCGGSGGCGGGGCGA